MTTKSGKIPQKDAGERLPVRSVKLTIAYDGTRFKGWQKGNGRTIQDVVEQAILAALPRSTKGAVAPGTYSAEQLHLVGSGRTDAGVHAEGQTTLLEGSHDFTSFTADKSKSNRIRTIYEIRVEQQEQNLELYFTADSFLWNQVRIMTMVLVRAGLGTMQENDVIALLEAKNCALAPEPAPAKGLCLYSVEY